MVRECCANGRWIGRSAAMPPPAERQACLWHRPACALVCLRRLVCHPARSARSTWHRLIVRAGWAFSSLLSGTPDGARLLLVCRPWRV